MRSSRLTTAIPHDIRVPIVYMQHTLTGLPLDQGPATDDLTDISS